MTVDLRLTTAGRTLLADGENVGVRAVQVTRVATGDGTGAFDASLTALRSQQDIGAATGTTDTPGRLAIRADLSPTSAYSVTEIGVFGRVGADGDETLLLYWSGADATEAAAGAVDGNPLRLAGAVDITDSDAAITVTPSVSITVGEAVEDATATQRGIVELATPAEARAGTDTERAVTPAGARSAIDDRVPNASTTTRGKVELATSAEGRSGTDTERAMTPAATAAAITGRLPGTTPNASSTVRGIVELATAEEAVAGTDNARAATPLGVRNAIDARVPAATKTTAGKAELATNDEADAETDDERIMTPAKVARRIGARIAAIAQATATAFGLTRYATDAEVDAGTSTARSVTPAGVARVDPRGRQTLWLAAMCWIARATSFTSRISIAAGGTNRPYVPRYSFASSSTQYIEILVGMPKGWKRTEAFKARVVWYHTSDSNGGTVAWRLRAVNISENDVVGTSSASVYGTEASVNDASAAANRLRRSGVSGGFSGASPAEGDVVAIQLYRDTDATQDTLAATAYFVGLELYYDIDDATDD